ncbi:unnamed protein product [Pleuronectes platessa]|uniref:Uncharacterized protein n=1 Tax=Pleuronectes platessa TaxID=8262 RepID=A0A9N7TLU0_PLEPL|nr:unnamed protein product [Pleuronectes platessa]
MSFWSEPFHHRDSVSPSASSFQIPYVIEERTWRRGPGSNTWPHTIAPHHQQLFDASVNERRRTKGINCAGPAERVTTVTSRVSREPGMKRLQATPRPTHNRTHAHAHPSKLLDNRTTVMGIWERGSGRNRRSSARS